MMEFKTIGIISILISLINYIKCVNVASSPSLYCTDLNPQNNVDIEQILGMWYGSEVISHHDTIFHGEVDFNSCVTIHLTDVTHERALQQHQRPDMRFQEYHDRQGYQYELSNQRPYGSQFFHYLRLIWTEQEKNIEYTLRYNTSRRGYWINEGQQSGTLVGQMKFNQFTGTVQVMKAVGNHMVLTFCENLPGSQLFSIVLSRKPDTLSVDDLQSVRSLLNRRGLSSVSVRRVCNGSSSIQNTSILSLIAIFITFLLKQSEAIPI